MTFFHFLATLSLLVFTAAQEIDQTSTSSSSKATTEEGLPHQTQSIEYETSIQKSVAWLITQREADWGWRNDTPKVLVALQMSQSEELSHILPNSLEMQLSMKQMEIEIVTLLWR